MVLCLGDKVPILPVIKATSRITLDSLRSIKSIFFLRYSLKETFVSVVLHAVMYIRSNLDLL